MEQLEPYTVGVFDLDGTCVYNEPRAMLAQKPGGIDWQVMYDPQLILTLDEPMPEALKVLKELDESEDGVDTIWYLSSREEVCTAATIQWLEKHGYPHPNNVICRPSRERTIVFKAREVAFLNNEIGKVVLFVDDSAANREAVAALGIVGLEIRSSL